MVEGNCVKISDIAAIQILGEDVVDEDGSFKSSELNIILKNARRITVIDHSNLKGILQDARYLSEYLNIPIWTAEDSPKD